MKKLLPLLLLFVSPLAFGAINLSLSALVEVIIYLLIVGGVLWLLLWLVGYIGLPEPFAKVAKIIIMVVGVLICINVLLSFAGSSIFNFR